MNSQILKIGFIFALASLSLIIFQHNSRQKELAEYEQWKHKFNINYESAFEDLYRQTLFLKKKAFVELHNQNKTQKFVRGLNQFSALTQ